MGSDNNSLSPKLDHLEVSKTQQASKKRKDMEKRVVEVKIGRKNGILIGKVKNEGPPSDSWSWRKYGQKPIKGSPYPRGYYRCSTSKGCSAKKQVERCKTDDSLLIITYTSSHNHPGPHDQDQQIPLDHDHDQDDHGHINIKNDTTTINSDVEHIHNRSSSSLEDIIVNVDTLTSATNSNNALDKELISKFSSSSPQDENDFFDELEELPTNSKFESFVRTQLYDEIKNYNPVVPSLI